jgi:ectoine hydroxylase-related dioxygenase (phytanoyl-CoA dioxygenase family)
MSVGDALLFDSRLWHCAGTNNSDQQRNAVKMLYTRRWYRPVFDHTRSVRPAIVAAMGKRGRQLLGFGSSPAISVVELRTGEQADCG